MTTPTHVSKMPPGGILTQHVDTDWSDYAAGRPVTQRVIAAVVQASKISSGNTQSGRTKGVGYEDVHFVEITDPHEADKLRRLITVARADRGLQANQPTLFALTDAEQCEFLIDMIKERASELDKPMAEIDKQWWDYFGGGEADGLSETVQACRSVLLLKEFALEVGAIAEEQPDEAGDEGDQGDEPGEAGAESGVASVPFQAGT